MLFVRVFEVIFGLFKFFRVHLIIGALLGTMVAGSFLVGGITTCHASGGEMTSLTLCSSLNVIDVCQLPSGGYAIPPPALNNSGLVGWQHQ